MRKNIFAIATCIALMAVACTKEDNIRPIFDTPTPLHYPRLTSPSW